MDRLGTLLANSIWSHMGDQIELGLDKLWLKHLVNSWLDSTHPSLAKPIGFCWHVSIFTYLEEKKKAQIKSVYEPYINGMVQHDESLW